MTTSEEKLINQKLKSEGNNQTTDAESSCIKKPTILITIIVSAVIVVVVVLAVVLTKDDDSSESSVVDDVIGDIGDERWVEAYKKAKKFLKPFSYDEKYRLFYGDPNVSKTFLRSICPISERGFPGICLQDGPAGLIIQQHGKPQ